MDISKISIGEDAPNVVNAIIENPLGGVPVKYELDKDSGAMVVDRFLHTSMFYPGNYGFIPHTLSGDGDPVDIIAVGRTAVMPGAVIPLRPVGVLLMEDDGGVDEKIIAVPAIGLNSQFENIDDIKDLPESLTKKISHFFETYKDLEKGKWVKIQGFEGAAKAKEVIKNAIIKADGENMIDFIENSKHLI